MSLSDQEKTEAPTQKKRDETRKDGRIPRSPELTTSFALLGGAVMLNVAGPAFGEELMSLFGFGLTAVGNAPLTLEGSVVLLRAMGWRTLLALAGWGLAIAGIAIAIAAPQARGVVSTKPMTPDFSRLSPMQNGKKVLGVQSWVELVKSLAKLALVALVVRSALGAAWPDMMALSQEAPFALLIVVKKYAVKLLMTSGLCYLVLAAADYVWQIWTFEKQLKMSRDEIKQEMKQSEGDPLMKQRLRSFGRSLARRQMMKSVPKADLVITNPTHIAIAIQYDPDKAPAPIVVAMGQRKMAERIKQIAHENGVPMIENKPLARALLASARVGSMIPTELYVAVAEILAFIIRRRILRGAPLREVVA